MTEAQQSVTAPGRVAELEQTLADIEHQLLVAQRANSTARGGRGLLLAQGEARAIAENRRLIDDTDQQVRDLTEQLQFSREALGEAKGLALARLNRVRLDRIDKALSALVERATECEQRGTPAALMSVREARRLVAEELNASGVAHSPLFDAHIFNDIAIVQVHELAAWVDSGGIVGKGPGLDSASQVRESGRASMGREAANFRGYALRVARTVLNVSELSEVT